MRAEISFKMRVVSPSETVWSSSYELFCVGSKKYLTWRAIFDLFCVFRGPILEATWANPRAHFGSNLGQSGALESP